MNTAENSPQDTTDHLELDIAGREVVAFYLILDQSASMSGELEALRQSVNQIVAELRAHAETDDTAMLGVISFGTTAQITIPLSRLSDITAVPQLTVLGGTNFGAAWNAYDQAFHADKKAIRAKNVAMHRPLVFFLADGLPYPDDEGQFRQTFLSTLGGDATKAWPYVIAYGFRDASAPLLKDIAYPDFGETRGLWFLSRDGDPAAAVRQFASLVFTVVSLLTRDHVGLASTPEQILARAGLTGAAIEYGSASPAERDATTPPEAGR